MIVARWFLPALLIAALYGASPVAAQEAAPAAASASAEAAKVDEKGTKGEKKSGRLPKFYERVIDGIQREKIYDIQLEYSDRIKKLQDQIDAIKKERDEKVEAVLTAEQRDRIKQYEREAIEN
ncbi:MAG TPA: hypothetical protein VGE52_02665 [Pirellulales bacterium]